MSRSRIFVQVRLHSGTTERTCLLDNPDLKTGMDVTLKDEDPEQRWTVNWVSNNPVNLTDVHTDWKVGGL
jgi:hypothetical protein